MGKGSRTIRSIMCRKRMKQVALQQLMMNTLQRQMLFSVWNTILMLQMRTSLQMSLQQSSLQKNRQKHLQMVKLLKKQQNQKQKMLRNHLQQVRQQAQHGHLL